LSIIRDKLLSLLAGKFRIDADQRILWPYSLRGSFSAWFSHHDPSLFRNYIFAGENLIHFRVIQKLFGGEIFKPDDTENRRVFISYDRAEIPDPEILKNGAVMLQNPDSLPSCEIELRLTKRKFHASSQLVTASAAP